MTKTLFLGLRKIYGVCDVIDAKMDVDWFIEYGRSDPTSQPKTLHEREFPTYDPPNPILVD